jgi:hypothetical protein
MTRAEYRRRRRELIEVASLLLSRRPGLSIEVSVGLARELITACEKSLGEPPVAAVLELEDP